MQEAALSHIVGYHSPNLQNFHKFLLCIGSPHLASALHL